MSGYNSWLTTCALWRRIVDLMRKPSVALLDWCQGGIRRLGLRDRDDWHDRAGRVPSLHCAIPTPSSHKAPIANSGGAIVARSRILVSGSTATLLGTMTNETGFDVYFSGLSPRVIARHRWQRTYPVRRLQLAPAAAADLWRLGDACRGNDPLTQSPGHIGELQHSMGWERLGHVLSVHDVGHHDLLPTAGSSHRPARRLGLRYRHSFVSVC